MATKIGIPRSGRFPGVVLRQGAQREYQGLEAPARARRGVLRGLFRSRCHFEVRSGKADFGALKGLTSQTTIRR